MWPSATRVTAIKSGKMRVTGNVKDSSSMVVSITGKMPSNFLTSSVTHKSAVGVVITLPRTTGNVGEMLSSTLAAQERTS